MLAEFSSGVRGVGGGGRGGEGAERGIAMNGSKSSSMKE